VISEEAFKNVLAGLMIGVTLWTLWNPLGARGAAPSNRFTSERRPQ